MAGSVNKVILIGNLGRDPEVRSFQQLRDILAGMELPEGAYYIKGQEAREL